MLIATDIQVAGCRVWLEVDTCGSLLERSSTHIYDAEYSRRLLMEALEARVGGKLHKVVDGVDPELS